MASERAVRGRILGALLLMLGPAVAATIPAACRPAVDPPAETDLAGLRAPALRAPAPPPVSLAPVRGVGGPAASLGSRRTADSWDEPRHLMVEQQIRQRGVTEPRVLAAMERVPRHLFVPESQRAEAYTDTPLPIGQGQTISQPYIVALMTELLGVGPGDRVLEIGTGSGYQAAVLAEMVGSAGQVYTIEIVAPLGMQARRNLESLGYGNIHLHIGDGYKGWPEHAPFDAIIVTAAPPEVPQPLRDQVKVGGRIVLPVGEVWQDLQVLTKRPDGTFDRQNVLPVRFVPMTGEAQRGHR